MEEQTFTAISKKSVRDYREYQAWLQTGGIPLVSPLRLERGIGVSDSAIQECEEGFVRLYGKDIWQPDAEKTVSLALDTSLPPEGYRLSGNQDAIKVEGADSNGILYGVFALLTRLGAGEPLGSIRCQSAPAVARRVLNHWDNADGTVERGYAGNSLFFREGRLNYDPKRIRDYARLLASVGINVLVPNNVNVSPDAARLISDEMLPKVTELAGILRPYGIKLSLAVHFESPVIVGGLATCDPLEPSVVSWWQERIDAVYRYIPDFSGFLVKADSEFRGGPQSLGRTQADGANMLARSFAPHRGVVYWRCFIYNCMQDWRDRSIDRPKAAYDLFMPMDGLFDSNVILQVKNGPSDFQVREPNSPLLGAMTHTRQALELQITQEYTGQQIDVYNLAVQWEEVLGAPAGGSDRLSDLIGGKIDTVAAVANVGDDENWTGHTLAQLNLFAFGRLAWNPRLTAEELTREWVKLTFGHEPKLLETVSDILMRSRAAYESYTTPLGLCWMVNIHHHYGPSPEGYEFMKWGTYHRADTKAIGIDRTANGTGYANQYPPETAAVYSDVNTCPEELLLYFHRLPYSFRLKSGQTLLQYIYDTHFTGAEEVLEFIRLWDSLEAELPETAYRSVRKRLLSQLENAKEWRDVINTYFYRKTGAADEKGRRIFE